MAVTVNIPLKIRVDRHAVAGQLEEIGDAVSRGVLRALRRSREAALDARGGYASVCLNGPTFAWRGDQALLVSGETRERVEKLVTAILLGAAENAGLFDYAALRDEAPEVLPDDIFEAFNPSRYDPRTGTYEIPSYRGKPKKIRASLKQKKPATPPSEFITVTDWIYFANTQDDYFRTMVAAAISSRFAPGPPPPLFALVFRMISDAFPRLGVIVDYQWPRVTRLKVPKLEEKGPDTPSDLDAEAVYTFKFVSDASEGSTGWEKYRENTFERARKTLQGKVDKAERGSAEDKNRELDAKAREIAEKHLIRVKDTIGGFYDLEAPGREAIFFSVSRATHALFAGRSVPVVSVTHQTTAITIVGKAPEGAGAKKVEEELLRGSGPDAAAQGDGEGQVGGMKGGRGVVIAPEYSKDPRASKFIAPRGAKFDPHYFPKCEPYDREPPIAEFGQDGELMRDFIQQIADRLEMPTCDYAARFCINAAHVLGKRALQVQQFSLDDEKGKLYPLSVGAVNEAGNFYFEPVKSVGIQYLYYLAETIPLLRRLNHLVKVTVGYRMQEEVYTAWIFHWQEQFLDRAWPAVKDLYLYACQFTMAQLLGASMDNIQARLDIFPDYVKTFRVLIQYLLSDNAELIILRGALERFKKIAGEAKGEEAYQTVHRNISLSLSLSLSLEYRRYLPPDVIEERMRQLAILAEHSYRPDLLLRLADQENWVLRRAEPGVAGVGHITQRSDGAWVIRDSKGWDWTLDELIATLAVRQDYAKSIDPLVAQMAAQKGFVSAVKRLADDPDRIEPEVRKLLEEMKSKNEEVMQSNRASYRYAFEHGQFHKDLANPTIPRTRWQLQGVHLFAHQAIGDAFKDDPLYRNALDSLISHEVGGRELVSDLLFVGTIAISIICPPLGAAVGLVGGIASGISERRHAAEKLQIYESLLVADPDQVLNRAEIELEMFLAQLGIALSALSAIPLGRGVIKGAQGAAKAVLREGFKQGAKRIAVDALRSVFHSVAEQLKKNLAAVAAKELAEEYVEDLVINKVMDVVIKEKIRQIKERRKAEGA